MLRHPVAQKVNGMEAELAFVRVDYQTVLAEALAKQTKVGAMLLPRATSHDDVFHVDEQEVEPPTHGVHQALEGLRGVLEAEGHVQELKQPKMGDYRHLRHILRSHGDLVVTPD